MGRSGDYTVAEFFAGIGLVRMGLESAGWQVVFATDFSPKKSVGYRRFFPGGADYLVRDVFDLKASDIPDVKLATCSFPCVDLSLAGNRAGLEGRQSGAFRGFACLIAGMGGLAPETILIENVPGLLTSHGGQDLREVIRSLNGLGYACDAFLLDAARFVPQSRLRLFIVGSRGSLREGKLHRIDEPRIGLTSETLDRRRAENSDLDWFRLDLPEPPAYGIKKLGEIIEALDRDEPIWWGEAEAQRHLEMMSPSHRSYVEELRYKESFSYRTFYRRVRREGQRAEVRRDELAGCLRTIGGGSGKQFLLRAGRGDIRMRELTVREYARLQGVPDEYDPGKGNDALSALGDAVCVPAIEWIGKNLRFQLNG